MKIIKYLISILNVITFFYSMTFAQTGWEKQNSKTTQNLTDVFFINSDTGWIIGFAGTILNTVNGGESWNLQNGNTSENLLSLFFTDYYNGWIVGLNGTVLHTNNGGNKWIQQTIEAENNFFDIFFLNDTLGWICGDNNYPNDSPSIYKTNNGGNSWFIANNELSGQYENIYFANKDTGWSIGDNVVKTIDGGNTWTQKANFSNIHSASFVNENIIYCAYGVMGAIIYKTTDGGDNWATINIPNQTSGFSDVFFIDENIGWLSGIGEENALILKTADGGINWYEINNPLQNVPYCFYFISDSKGWLVGYDGSIYKYRPAQSSVLNNINNFHQNIEIYPNPFTFEILINFSLHQPCITTIKIYNSIGQEIEILVNEFQAAGVHEITWQPKGLPSGIYFYRLQTGESTETKKLILLK